MLACAAMEEPEVPRPSSVPLYAKERLSLALFGAATMITNGLVIPGWFVLRCDFLNRLGTRVRVGKAWPGLAFCMSLVGNVAILADQLARDPKLGGSFTLARRLADVLVVPGFVLALIAMGIVVKLSLDVASLLEEHRVREGGGKPVSKLLAGLLGPIYLQYRLNLLAGPAD